MYSRIVNATLKVNRIDEARQTFASEVLPQLRKQPGFIDLIDAIDTQTGQFVCTTLWRTREDADRYGQTEFAKAATRLREYLQNEPTVTTMLVENSTIHNIAKGKQAAA